MPFLAPLLAGISRLFATRIGFWILSALAFLGIQFAATEFVVEPLLDYIKGALGGAPATILEFLAWLRVDDYVTVVLSAYTTAAATGALKMRKKPA